jgi:hypothetical protein
MKILLFILIISLCFSCGENTKTENEEESVCKDVICGEGSCVEVNAVATCVCNDGYSANGLTCELNEVKGFCEPLEASTGNIINVDTSMVGELQNLINNANSGDVFLFKDGIYNLHGKYLWIKTPNVTLRSKSGNPEAVIIDGNYETTEIITVAASNVTIAEITIQKAYTHPIHVVSTDNGNTENTLIYRVNIIDPREQGIKINTNSNQYFADNGEIACSTIKMTDEGRPHINPTSGGCYTGGVDAHQASGWVIRDNDIRGFWCNSGLSEHAIHLWRGCKDTIVKRNILTNNARGVGFGLSSSGSARKYDNDECNLGDTYVGHYSGVIKNNFIYANSNALFNSNSGFDCGVCLASACNTKVIHNTIVSTSDNFSSIEWRFAGSQNIEVTNNIVTHNLRAREDANATLTTNLESASLSIFVDGNNGDLHLKESATNAINKGSQIANDLCTIDIDGDTRDNTPDIGADEVL